MYNNIIIIIGMATCTFVYFHYFFWLFQWEESTVAMDTFHTAVARSVTSHCAIFPEACSLIAGCAQFFG